MTAGRAAPDTGGAAVARALGDAASGTARTVWRAWVVLALLLLVPLALGLAVAGAFSLYGGDLAQGAVLLGIAGYLAWYCTGLLRRRGGRAYAAVLGGDGDGE
ncbi:hypothetical protein [Streptomyces sp. NPDC059906]|uniref:hypothetical protein n=1 Tax=Streptomyces sp. NPDC059906 TaxID=3346997 RepID=UPI00365DBFEC